MFVPKSERITMMECLHLSHLGFANTFSVARSRYFWEGMKADLLKFIGRCCPCIEFQDHRPFETELKRENLISAPMEWIGADLFYFEGSHFLFLVDGFSQFSWFHKFGPAPTSLQVVNVLKKMFLEYGALKQMRVDGGAKFFGAFLEFCDENCITIERASPYNPTSNASADTKSRYFKEAFEKISLWWR